MGCFRSKTSVRHPANITAFQQLYRINKEDFTALRISSAEARQLFGVFLEMDGMKTGSLHVNKILRYCGIAPTPFAKRALSAWEKKSTGKLTFHHFVVILWSICSLSPHVIGDYVFDLYDADGSKDLDKEEVQQLIMDLFGDDYAKNIDAIRVNREISNLKKDQCVDIEMFHRFTKLTESLLQPALGVQLKLIHNVLGPEFWMRHKKRRAETYSSRRYLRVNEICHAYKLQKKKHVPKELIVLKDDVNSGHPEVTPSPPLQQPEPGMLVGTVEVAPVTVDGDEDEDEDEEKVKAPMRRVFKPDYSAAIADLRARSTEAKRLAALNNSSIHIIQEMSKEETLNRLRPNQLPPLVAAKMMHQKQRTLKKRLT